MDVTVRLQGTSPLLMHNSQLADPDNDYTLAIKKISDKRSKTPQDREDMSKLEFAAGLHLDTDGRPAIPMINVIRCFANAAKARRKGKDVERAVVMKLGSCQLPDGTVAVPLTFSGPSNMQDRLAHGEPYVDRRIVGLGGRVRLLRTRPKFPGWALTVELLLDETVLSFDDFTDIAEAAGVLEGLGDARRLGMGRFVAEVVK